MEDFFAVTRVLIALLFYITAYILPLVLILSAVIRLALRWHISWRLISTALLVAVLQIYAISTLTPQNVAFFVGAALTVIATILFTFATRGHRSGIKLFLDIALFVIVLVYTIMNVDWVVG